MSAARSNTEKDTRRRPPKDKAEVPKGTPEQEYPRRMLCATAAQLLNLSVSYIRHATAAGECPAAIRHGRKVTYDRELLLAWRTKAPRAA